jgi:transcriptional regulator with XRE-family HTH domain
MHVGHRVRRRRLRLGISQKELGAAVGVSFQQVQKYKSGANRIGASRLQQIATVLQAPPSYFFEQMPKGETPAVLPETPLTGFAPDQEQAQLATAFGRIADEHVRKSILRMVIAVGSVNRRSSTLK